MGQLFYGRHLKINFVTFEDVTPFVSPSRYDSKPSEELFLTG